MINHKTTMQLLDEGETVWGYSIGVNTSDDWEDNPPIEGPYGNKVEAEVHANQESRIAIDHGESGQINWYKAQIVDATELIDFDEVIETISNYITESHQVEVDFGGNLEEWIKGNVSIDGHLGRSFVWMLEAE